MADPITLADLGEAELLRRLALHAPPGQFEDDAALLEERPGGTLVINTDVLVEGVHFTDATTGAVDLGWRAAAANLSDLAAMGCREVVGLTVALVAPGSTTWDWVEGVYKGLGQALGTYGGHLMGGDCSGGAQRLLGVSAFGRLGPGGPIRRGDGRPNDWIVTTGCHGLSRLGLALLLDEPLEVVPDAGLRERALAAHRRPRPRFDAVTALELSRPADLPWRVAGTDSSDGLLAAVGALAMTSGCDAELELERLPLDPAMAQMEEARAWCLRGGEDFELVLALPPAWAEAFLEALPHSHRIGELSSGPGVVRWRGSPTPLGAGLGGYAHFGSPKGSGELRG